MNEKSLGRNPESAPGGGVASVSQQMEVRPLDGGRAMSPEAQRKALKRLIKKWKLKEASYQKAAWEARKQGLVEASRYEGESIAFRWCWEDLQTALKALGLWKEEA